MTGHFILFYFILLKQDSTVSQKEKRFLYEQKYLVFDKVPVFDLLFCLVFLILW